MNVLQDVVIKYTNFHFCITICYDIKQLSKTTTLPYVVFERWSSQDLILMFYDCTNGLHQEESLENLKQLFGKNAPSRTQVFVWFGEFRRGRRSFDDERRCGTPATAVTVANIEPAEKLIRVEPRVTTREFQQSL